MKLLKIAAYPTGRARRRRIKLEQFSVWFGSRQADGCDKTSTKTARAAYADYRPYLPRTRLSTLRTTNFNRLTRYCRRNVARAARWAASIAGSVSGALTCGRASSASA